MSNKVVYLQIESDSNYYNTFEQIRIKNTSTFADASAPRLTLDSTTATGFFSGRRIVPDPVINNSSTYPTSSVNIDPSGNSRPILSLNIDYYSSSSIDIYKQGVEITDQKQWAAGMVKITAGTPGHLYESQRYGINEVSIVDPDKYFELEPFNPVTFVESGGDPSSYTFPVVTSEINRLENFVLNGIIEPFAIRSVISNFSINVPLEPHSFKCVFSDGNVNYKLASDQVLSLDYFEPQKQNSQAFLDAIEHLGVTSPELLQTGVRSGEYLLLGENRLSAFEDVVPPRGYINSASYPNDLLNTIYSMLPGGTTYVSNKQRSATCGFVYNNAEQGTDSIAYGGLLY